MKIFQSFKNSLICNNPKKGLNIVELSVVILVISLIVGGALAGKEMLRNSKMRFAALKLEKYDAAVAGFYDRYQYLPGDIPLANATNFFGANGTIIGGGNGNGMIECCGTSGDSSVNSFTGEILYFWNHLSLSDLVQEQFSYNGTTVTISGFQPPFGTNDNQKIGIFAYTYNAGSKPENRWHFVLKSPNASDFTSITPAMTNKDVFVLDTKIDDGLPASGTMLGYDGVTPGALTSGNCAVLTSGVYYYNTTSPNAMQCQVEVKMKF